jgi:hypothetical protein
MMSSAVQNLAVSLVALQSMYFAPVERSPSISSPVARKIPFDDPVVLSYVRIGYVSVQAIILATYYWVSLTVCSIFLPTNALSHMSTGKPQK